MTRPTISRRKLTYRFIAATAGLALLTGQSGELGARALGVLSPSPARDHAEVIAQGVVELDRADRVWRLVERDARDEREATALDPETGFLLGADVTLVGDPDGRRLARLANGEAYFVAGDQRIVPASPVDDDATFFTLELVDSATARPRGGNILESSSAFETPDGERDLDLVRDVLGEDDVLTLADSDAPTLLYVQSGEVELTEDGVDRPRTLEADAFLLLEGESSLENVSEEAAVVFAAVIGPEILALPVEIVAPATATSAPAAPAPSATPSPTAATAPVALGSAEVAVYECPATMTQSTFHGGSCARSSGDWEVWLGLLTGPTGTWQTGDALFRSADTVNWTDLPYGTYALSVIHGPSGRQASLVSAAGGVAYGEPYIDGGFVLDASHPAASAAVYFLFATDLTLDTDLDGLTDVDETADSSCASPSDPTSADTDGDGIEDGAECFVTLTNPVIPDSDGDLLGDGDESLIYTTDPLHADTDRDLVYDGEEVFASYGYTSDPLLADTDGDGLSDATEQRIFTTGWVTDPSNPDTDGDTLSDLEESVTYLTSPVAADTDADGFTDDLELAAGFDPNDGTSHP